MNITSLRKPKSLAKISLKKRLLLVASSAPPVIGTEFVYNLLSQFSPESYCILTNYRRIKSKQVSGSWLEGEYFFCDLPKPRPEKNAPALSSGSVPARTYQRFLRFAESRVPYPVARMLFLNVYPILTILRMVRMGLHIVRERDIGCILATFDGGPSFIAAYVISRFTRVPYLLHSGDIYVGNRLDSPVLELLARIFERPLFQSASTIILNNQAGERFYRRRYGDTFRCATLHNSVLAGGYESKRTPYNPTEPYRIVFTGNVYWAQERSLLNLVRTMDSLRDLHVELDLYVLYADANFKRIVSGHTNIHLASATHADMPTIQCGATILFLPLAWYSKSPYIVATVTPGKLSEYLASGRPILIHAPPYAYVNEYARENNCALVVDEEDTDRLKDGIKKLLFNLDYSRKLVGNAQKTFYRDHEVSVNAERLFRIIDSVEGTETRSAEPGPSRTTENIEQD